MRLILVIILSVLAGCASQLDQGVQSDVNWSSHRNRVLDIQHWSASGKVGARQGEASTSFNLIWTQSISDFDIRLFGPLGQGAVKITGDDTQATLYEGNNATTSSDLESLIAENHSIQLPLNALQYWIRGVPEPFQPATIALGTQGLISKLNQFGWVVSYADYEATEPPMPRKFSLTRGDMSVKIIVKTWELDAQP